MKLTCVLSSCCEYYLKQVSRQSRQLRGLETVSTEVFPDLYIMGSFVNCLSTHPGQMHSRNGL